MKYPLRIPRMPSKLSDSLHLRLNTYALAASTAGVGMLALAQTVDAKIVHTPVYEKIPPTFGWIWFPISLTNNGVYDGAFANVDTFSIKQLWFDAYGGAGFIMVPYLQVGQSGRKDRSRGQDAWLTPTPSAKAHGATFTTDTLVWNSRSKEKFTTAGCG